ncbi:MAG: agmatine deiminase family protein [Clostridia bacterium]|jgi:agmatine deiminase|nr:agmatine deiminase family protein [Clostridia bacterium]
MYPRENNFRMPAEGAPHQCTLVSWPVKEALCFPEDYEAVCRGYSEIIRAIAEFEPVALLANPAEEQQLRSRFQDVRVAILPMRHNDAWMRDNGPTFLVDAAGALAGVNWKFNAWGEKYAPWDLDDALAPQILAHFRARRFDAPLVLEGGSIHVDGAGTLLTTEECLLHPNRNPGLTKKQIEEYLKQYLHVDKIIWLKRGLYKDETDGHIDNIACFVAPGKVLLQVCTDKADENYEITRENLAVLSWAADAQGRALEIIPVRQPPAMYVSGKRLTLSYLNFYLVNGGLILPVFGEAAGNTDDQAVKVLQGVFPDRRIRTIDGRTLIKEGGNVHCITQQVPAV